MKKKLLSILLWAVSSVTFAQPFSVSDAAESCLQDMLAQLRQFLPISNEAYRTTDVELDDEYIIYHSTTTSLNTYSALSGQVGALKESFIDSFRQNINNFGFLMALLSDTSRELKYVFYSPAKTSKFSIVFTTEDIADLIGPNLDVDARRRIVGGYLKIISSTYENGTSLNLIPDCLVYTQASPVPDYRDVTRKIDKDYYLDIIRKTYERGEAGVVIYNMSIYLGCDYREVLVFNDREVGVTIPYEDVIGAKRYGESRRVVYATQEEIEASDRLYEGLLGDESRLLASIEIKPAFQGGDASAFAAWVHSQLVYPEIAKENGVQGEVKLQFTVMKDGSVGDVKVLKGVDISLDREAVRVVKSSPKWTPAEHKGEKVKVTYTFPVIFMLTDSEE